MSPAYIQDYFTGKVMAEEPNPVAKVNILIVYHICMVVIVWFSLLQILYIFTSTPFQSTVNATALTVFIGGLFLLRKKQYHSYIYNGLTIFSILLFSVNLVIFPHVKLSNGLHMASNLMVVAYLFDRRTRYIYSFFQILVVVIYLSVVHYCPSIFLDSQLVLPMHIEIVITLVSFSVLFVIVSYYQMVYRTANDNLSASHAALTVSESQRKQSQSIAHIGNWKVNTLDDTIQMDEETHRILGIDPLENLTLELLAFRIHPQDRGILRDALKLSRLNDTPYNIDCRAIVPDQGIKKINIFGSIQQDSKGGIICFYGIIQDITIRKKNEEVQQQILESLNIQNTQLKNFAYIVSHNLRSHSSNIKGLLAMHLPTTSVAQKEQILNMLHLSADKLDETLQDLNDIIAISEAANAQMINKGLAAEIRKALDIHNDDISRLSAKVTLSVPCDMLVEVIPAYCDSILLNLISNALKYHEPSRQLHLHISAICSDGYVVLSIRDNGLGIDMQRDGDKVFGLYKTFHHHEDARGVGLYLTRNHIEAMRGKILVESEPGVGSTFSVYFYISPV